MTREEQGMYERSYGYRYGEVESGHAPDIAKRMRQDIKEAIAEGLLPGKPVVYSVTSESYTGGQSINIVVKGFAGAWEECPGTDLRGFVCRDAWCAGHNDSPHAKAHLRLTAEADAMEMTLKRIHSAYNHDGSEIQTDYFDVRYYGGVRFERVDEAQWRAEEKVKAQAKKAAREAAAAVETKKVLHYGRVNRHVHLATEVDGRVKLLCGASAPTYSLRIVGEGSVVTCTRCAKKEGK